MRERYWFGLVFLIGFLMMVTFFWLDRERKETVHIGSSIPKMKYLTRDGLQVLAADSTRPLVILYFNRKCEHCLYQLDLLEKSIDLFGDQKFIFLTSEMKFLAEGSEKRWSILSIASSCTFGVVYSKDFLNAFGTIGTPALFIFNRRGMLIFKNNGEVKIEKLKQVLGIKEQQAI
jgi:hypothetical protein